MKSIKMVEQQELVLNCGWCSTVGVGVGIGIIAIAVT